MRADGKPSRRRGTGSRAAAKAEGEASAASQPLSAEARRKGLLQDAQQRLRARTKDVMPLLKLVSVSFVAPQHVVALLTTLEAEPPVGARRLFPV